MKFKCEKYEAIFKEKGIPFEQTEDEEEQTMNLVDEF